MKKALKFLSLSIYFYQALLTTNHNPKDSPPYFDEDSSRGCYLILAEAQEFLDFSNLCIFCLSYSLKLINEDENDSFNLDIKYRINLVKLKSNKEYLGNDEYEKIFDMLGKNGEKFSFSEIESLIKRRDINFLIFKGSEFSKNKEITGMIENKNDMKKGDIISKVSTNFNYINSLEFVVKEITENAEGEKDYRISTNVRLKDKIKNRNLKVNYVKNEIEDVIFQIFESFLDSESLEEKEEEMFGFKVKFIESDEEGKIQNLFSSNMFGNIKERSLKFDEKDIFTDKDFKKEITDSEQKSKESNSNNNEKKNADEEKNPEKEKESSNKTSLFSKILRFFVAIVFIITIVIVALISVRSKNSKKKIIKQ